MLKLNMIDLKANFNAKCLYWAFIEMLKIDIKNCSKDDIFWMIKKCLKE